MPARYYEMPTGRLLEGALTHSIIGAFYDVYNTLDFGFLEHVYKAALENELRDRGHKVEREARVVVHYKGDPIAVQIVDMIVDERVVVEAKSTSELRPQWGRQVQNYLRATSLQVGLLLHFGLEAKFYRIVELHSSREREKTINDTDCTDSTDVTNRSPTDLTSPATTDEAESTGAT